MGNIELFKVNATFVHHQLIVTHIMLRNCINGHVHLFETVHLCSSATISTRQHTFYQNLITDESVQDTLAESDLEEDSNEDEKL